MRILITGGTGLIGRHLGRELAAAGHAIVVLARNPERARRQLPFPCEIHQWQGEAAPIPETAFDGVEGIINLAGEPIADGRWDEERKRRIRDSRILTTRTLVDAVLTLRARTPLRVFVSGSAIGYYGDRGDEILDEGASSGRDFLARVCVGWEEELARLEKEPGIRVVKVRTGIVLASRGGALEKMLPIFRMGLGGRIGSGRQWMSWTHIADISGLFRLALESESVSGVLNGVAPEPVRNREFTSALARALGTIAVLPVPEVALRLVFGELAGTLTGGARVSSDKARALGYRYQYPELKSALQDLIGSGSRSS